MGFAHVRFLHWVGFDPATELPPPDEETAEALAFLAYDVFGRIIEVGEFSHLVSALIRGNFSPPPVVANQLCSIDMWTAGGFAVSSENVSLQMKCLTKMMILKTSYWNCSRENS
jgi:hypothetical protein